MKTILIIGFAILVISVLPCAAATTNAPSTNALAALPAQSGTTETATVRVTDFTDKVVLLKAETD